MKSVIANAAAAVAASAVVALAPVEAQERRARATETTVTGQNGAATGERTVQRGRGFRQVDGTWTGPNGATGGVTGGFERGRTDTGAASERFRTRTYRDGTTASGAVNRDWNAQTGTATRMGEQVFRDGTSRTNDVAVTGLGDGDGMAEATQSFTTRAGETYPRSATVTAAPQE